MKQHKKLFSSAIINNETMANFVIFTPRLCELIRCYDSNFYKIMYSTNLKFLIL